MNRKRVAGLSKEPPLTAPEPSRMPSRLSLWAWATGTGTAGLPWAHEGQSPHSCRAGTSCPVLARVSALPRLGHDLSPRVSPGPSSAGTHRLAQGVGGCQPWGRQLGPDLRPLASEAMHTGCCVLWSRAPRGGLMETPLHWDPRREKERNVHPKHFSAGRPDSHVSDGRLPHQKLAGRVLKWLVAILTDSSPPPAPAGR